MTDNDIEIFKKGIEDLKKGISDSFYIFTSAIEQYPYFISMLLKDKYMEDDIEIIKKRMGDMQKEIFNDFHISLSKIEEFAHFMIQSIENENMTNNNTKIFGKRDEKFEKKDGDSNGSYFSLYV